MRGHFDWRRKYFFWHDSFSWNAWAPSQGLTFNERLLSTVYHAKDYPSRSDHFLL